jgi:ubiquitin C-terminal hydrolase
MFTGLANLYNNCFINAVIQCLRSFGSFRNILKSIELNSANLKSITSKHQLDMFSSFIILLTAPSRNDHEQNMQHFYQSFIPSSHFRWNAQADAQEFYIYIIEFLRNTLEKINEARALDLDACFKIFVDRNTECINGHSSNTSHFNWFIPLPVPNNLLCHTTKLTTLLKEYFKVIISFI